WGSRSSRGGADGLGQALVGPSNLRTVSIAELPGGAEVHRLLVFLCTSCQQGCRPRWRRIGPDGIPARGALEHGAAWLAQSPGSGSAEVCPDGKKSAGLGRPDNSKKSMV